MKKLLVISNFFIFHNAFQSLFLEGRKIARLYGNGLRSSCILHRGLFVCVDVRSI